MDKELSKNNFSGSAISLGSTVSHVVSGQIYLFFRSHPLPADIPPESQEKGYFSQIAFLQTFVRFTAFNF
eukprot:6316558-Amphidinium_carterae.1